MAKYTTEEIHAFKLKDILNSRMSALKAAATNNEGHKAKSVQIMGEADDYYEWLRQDQDSDVGGTPDTTLGNTSGATLGQLPEPTLAQKKVLDAIYTKLYGDNVGVGNTFYKNVLEWADEAHGQRAYPTKLESVETFLKWFNK